MSHHHRLFLLVLVLCAQLACGSSRSIGRGSRTATQPAQPSAQRQLQQTQSTIQNSDATYLRCHGLKAQSRSCLAHNLYYSIQQQTFVAVGWGNDAPAAPGNVTISKPDAKDYALEHYKMTWVSEDASPSPDKTLALPGLHVFWRFSNGGAGYSIGHAMVHELYPLFCTLDNLLVGSVPPAFTLVTMDSAVPEVFKHITPAIQDRQVNWNELCRQAAASGKDWIRIEVATLGDAGHSGLAQSVHYQRHPGPTMFNNMGWLRFRSWMLRSAGLNPAAPPIKNKQLVVLNDKVMPDGTLEPRRRIYNIAEAANHLQEHLPHVKVERVAFMGLSWRKQLQLLARTSVFVTTEGSSGFRYVFLPPGAAVIIVAHPDNMTEGAEVLGDHLQFHEIDKYFPFTFLRFFKYWVNIDHTAEYNITDVPAVTPEGRPRERKYQLYDAHIIVSLSRLLPMVQEALREVALHAAMHNSKAAIAAIP